MNAETFVMVIRYNMSTNMEWYFCVFRATNTVKYRTFKAMIDIFEVLELYTKETTAQRLIPKLHETILVSNGWDGEQPIYICIWQVMDIWHCMNYTCHSDSMERLLSSEANSRSASQVTPRLLWGSKLHYNVHKSPPMDYILSQLNPVDTLVSYFFNAHFL
jgi:hypothetical protein